MEIINNVAGAPRPVGAYSQAVKAAGLVFCAGQVGIKPETGELVSGGVESELLQILDNLGAVLGEAGSSWHHVVMTTIFLADISDAKVVNGLYGQVIDGANAPARQTVAVKDLPLGARVEISVVAEVAS